MRRALWVFAAMFAVLLLLPLFEHPAHAQATASGGGCVANCTFTGTAVFADAGVTGALTVTGTITSGVSDGITAALKNTSNNLVIQSPSGTDIVFQNSSATESGRFKNGGGLTTPSGSGVIGGAFLATAGASSLPTCSGPTRLRIYYDATGGTGAKFDKLCICSFDGTNYKWFNLLKGSGTATGTTTTCPDS